MCERPRHAGAPPAARTPPSTFLAACRPVLTPLSLLQPVPAQIYAPPAIVLGVHRGLFVELHPAVCGSPTLADVARSPVARQASHGPPGRSRVTQTERPGTVFAFPPLPLQVRKRRGNVDYHQRHLQGQPERPWRPSQRLRRAQRVHRQCAWRAHVQLGASPDGGQSGDCQRRSRCDRRCRGCPSAGARAVTATGASEAPTWRR